MLSPGGSPVGRSSDIYSSKTPVSPSAAMSFRVVPSGARHTYNWSGADVVAAYNAGRANNPLVSMPGYTDHRAIVNVTGFVHSFDLFHHIARSLQNRSTHFPNQRYFGDIAPNIIGVVDVGSSNAADPAPLHGITFRKQPLLLKLMFYHANYSYLQRASNNIFRNTAQYVDDNTSVHFDSIAIDTYLTELLARTPTEKLRTLISRGVSSGTSSNLNAAFTGHYNISHELTVANRAANHNSLNTVALWTLTGTGEVRRTSFLNLLASMVVNGRTGNLYTVTQLNPRGDDLLFNTHCGITRWGCFVLPFDLTYPVPDTRQNMVSGRFSAFLDTLWLVWPSLTAQQMHTLLASCTKDLGDTGVDAKYGQGLLDFNCVLNPSGGVQLPTGVQGVSGALYGASTASAALTTYDGYGRNFEHQVLHRNLQARPAFDPTHNAFVHKVADFLELTANESITSAWLTRRTAGNLHVGLGATYEGDSLFGMTGSGHFAIYDGRSLGVRLQLDQPLSNFWNMRLSLAHYRGTARASYPGAVSDLALEQSNTDITFERRFTDKASARFKAACSSGNSGSFNSFGTRIELFGVGSCIQSIAAQIHF